MWCGCNSGESPAADDNHGWNCARPCTGHALGTDDPDGTVEDGDTISGLRVIHTPGHTPGHIALLHEPTKTLLTGDAVLHRGPDPAQGPDGLLLRPLRGSHLAGKVAR